MSDKSFEVERLFRRVYRKIRGELRDLFNGEISSNEYTVLRLLANESMRVSDVAKALNISASHLTAITDSLVNKQLIERKGSPTDRRVILLSLTCEGDNMLSHLEKHRSEYFQEKFKVFNEEELDMFIHLFRKLDNQ